jgi:hypothetical protein
VKLDSRAPLSSLLHPPVGSRSAPSWRRRGTWAISIFWVQNSAVSQSIMPNDHSATSTILLPGPSRSRGKNPSSYNSREREIVFGHIPTIDRADTVPSPFSELPAHPNDAPDVHTVLLGFHVHTGPGAEPRVRRIRFPMSREFSLIWQIDSLRGGISPSRTRRPFPLMVK